MEELNKNTSNVESNNLEDELANDLNNQIGELNISENGSENKSETSESQEIEKNQTDQKVDKKTEAQDSIKNEDEKNLNDSKSEVKNEQKTIVKNVYQNKSFQKYKQNNGNKKDEPGKKWNFKRESYMDARATSTNDLKSRLDFSTRVPTIVDDLYYDKNRSTNGYKSNNYKRDYNNQQFNRFNQKSDRKFDKPFEKKDNLDMIITRDLQSSSRHVSFNQAKTNHKYNNSYNGEKNKRKDEIKSNVDNMSFNYTPPPTPNSSKIDPPPGLQLPENFNDRFKDKDYANAIATLLMSNQLFGK